MWAADSGDLEALANSILQGITRDTVVTLAKAHGYEVREHAIPRELLYLADELGFGAQPVVYDGSGSDAGGVKRTGMADRTVAFGFPRDNSHGYEIAHSDSLVNVTKLLVAFLKSLP